jgi:hypothetical protein
MTSFLRRPEESSSVVNNGSANLMDKSNTEQVAVAVDAANSAVQNIGNTVASVTMKTELERSHVVAASVATAGGRSQSIVGYTNNDQVTKAEILWCLKSIMSHYSMNSSCEIKDIFQLMFRDSNIARRMTVGSTKIAYFICYGLAPYFHNALVTDLQKCQKIVVCFDEALNRIAQRGQMDVVIRYWDNSSNAVSTRYFGSAFMGHATAECLLTSFKKAISPLDIGSVMQVSMDGPSVNWKFLDLLAANLDEDMMQTQLLDLGSCGLHFVHGAMQYGHKASGWTVNAT